MPSPFFSVDHHQLEQSLCSKERLLIIQDLDGVCMDLVRDPLQRSLPMTYVDAVQKMAGEFYVLTNGEHIGSRGVNGIVERIPEVGKRAASEGLYLPGLAAGGVQWQDRWGYVSHPGVSSRELLFLRSALQRSRQFVERWLAGHLSEFDPMELQRCCEATVLDNMASPTINLNSLFEALESRPDLYFRAQSDTLEFFQQLLAEASESGLDGSFFLHLAPNLGSDDNGREILKPIGEGHSGTTDFQLMLTGAIKEAGVPALLNRYYYDHFGYWPLGESFNVREAPRDRGALLELMKSGFDGERMPFLVGVGDTLTSSSDGANVRRGGSDRGFLTLIQELGRAFGGAATAYVDSSGGQVRRPGVDPSRLPADGQPMTPDSWGALRGISDPDDPLQINYLFAQGSAQYRHFFESLAKHRHLD